MRNQTRSTRRFGTTTAAAALAVAAVIAPAAASAQAATTAQPAVPSGLPSSIESLAGYVPAVSCDPVLRAGTSKLGALLTSTYPGTSYQVTRACGSDPLPTSEHYDGRAIDWMVSIRDTTGKARAAAALSWLFAKDKAGHGYANARRLGVMYIIWNNKIWGAYNTAAGWRDYSSCKSHPETAWDTACHRNHMHLSLSWEGATGRTSFWTKKVAAPDYGPCRPADLNWAGPYRSANRTRCLQYPRVTAPAGSTTLAKSLVTYSGMYLKHGSTGPAVSAVQKALHIQPTGTFGPVTGQTLTDWQQIHELPVTGVMDAASWRTMLQTTFAS